MLCGVSPHRRHRARSGTALGGAAGKLLGVTSRRRRCTRSGAGLRRGVRHTAPRRPPCLRVDPVTTPWTRSPTLATSCSRRRILRRRLGGAPSLGLAAGGVPPSPSCRRPLDLNFMLEDVETALAATGATCRWWRTLARWTDALARATEPPVHRRLMLQLGRRSSPTLSSRRPSERCAPRRRAPGACASGSRRVLGGYISGARLGAVGRRLAPRATPCPRTPATTTSRRRATAPSGRDAGGAAGGAGAVAKAARGVRPRALARAPGAAARPRLLRRRFFGEPPRQR